MIINGTSYCNWDRESQVKKGKRCDGLSVLLVQGFIPNPNLSFQIYSGSSRILSQGWSLSRSSSRSRNSDLRLRGARAERNIFGFATRPTLNCTAVYVGGPLPSVSTSIFNLWLGHHCLVDPEWFIPDPDRSFLRYSGTRSHPIRRLKKGQVTKSYQPCIKAALRFSQKVPVL